MAEHVPAVAAEQVAVLHAALHDAHPASVKGMREQITALQAQVTSLERALSTSRMIGVAVGVLMSTRRLTGDAAFELLRTTSRHTHRTLRDLASEVALTGDLSTAP